MRPVTLSALRAGINRLKIKGGASAQQLYDLLNGYIDQSGSVQPREGTIRTQTLSSNTVGLCSNDGLFNVFATSLVSVPSGYKCNLLIHPTDPSQTLLKIWFAKPFMGFLYVVAEFANHDVFHYWLQTNGPWSPNTVYKIGTIINPTAENGLAYQAVRNFPQNSLWSPQTTIALNQIVEPTEYTGYVYKAVTVEGTAPHTSSSEPVWPTTTGGLIQEFGDFNSTANDTSGTTSTASQPLGSAITDRYGNSSTIAGQTGTSATGTGVIPTAQATVTTWAPGTLYSPGAVVQPSTNQGAFINAVPNGDFENGNDGSWVLSGGVAYSSTQAYQGTECLFMTANNNDVTAIMNNYGVVTPGQSVTASAYFDPHNSDTALHMYIGLRWYDSSDTFLTESFSGATARGNGWRKMAVTANAPTGAARVRVSLHAGNGESTNLTGHADLVEWSLEQPAAVSNFLYEAIQATVATSGSTEPTWPTVAGNTVVDGGVTWKAIGTSIITWQAIPLMLSGGSEPTWPTTIGIQVNDPSTFTDLNGVVVDTNMSWITISREVPTPNPNKAVVLGASHVFNGDNDIVDFSAAVDPTDWTSANNAGYLPTGLNNYGDNPVAVLALYRSNLMAFNAGGYQMWQIDPDPANMALLDAQPVGSIYIRGTQSVANDLLFVTEVGVRNIGTVGATANMQVGNTGQPVDPLVKAALKAGTYDPLSLYYPGRGQYWLFFGPQAFVLTINGTGLKTWSRYVFPDQITDWTLNLGKLYMRTAGNLIWQLDADTLVDDFGGANVNFNGVVQWPYLDAGTFGLNKMLIGVDLVGAGAVTIQIAYDETDATTFSDNPGFGTSLHVTAPYTISLADTLPGEPLPIPVNAPSYSLVLTFGPNQAWNWQAANLYVADASGGGATG